MNEKTIDQILERLENIYKDTGTALNFKSPFELLVATILSAQCTDTQVNKATSLLFREIDSPEKFAVLPEETLAQYIKSCGFYKVKSRNIINTSKELLRLHKGEVPHSLEELIRLPGVGRKTANVVLSNAFGMSAIAVDTHVFRVANRLGLSHSKTPEKAERDLMQVIPEDKWIYAHNWIIWHGRKVCAARKPLCDNCTLSDLCEYYNSKRDIDFSGGELFDS